MTNRIAPATTTRYMCRTADGRHFVRITLADGTKYVTPAYYTLEMAVADGQCWEAFRVVETPEQTRDRMESDEAAGVDVAVEDLKAGDFVWHTFEMKAAYNRKGQLVKPPYQVSKWVEVSGAWARDWARGEYGYRLFGFTFGYYGKKGQTVKTHRDPKALKAAQNAARDAVYAALSKR